METILFGISGVAWLVFEVGLIARDRARGKGGVAGDRRTRALTWGVGVVAIVMADVLAGVIDVHSPLWIPGAGPAGWPVIAGVVIIWLGLALRIWAIVVLGRSFRTTVEVDAEQAVVSNGPYRLVRHPSYTGILIIVIGFGLGSGTWPGLALCVVLPTLGLLRRIQVEEKELARVMGAPYLAYCQRTRRLVPGVW